jgi:hypothetical protein
LVLNHQYAASHSKDVYTLKNKHGQISVAQIYGKNHPKKMLTVKKKEPSILTRTMQISKQQEHHRIDDTMAVKPAIARQPTARDMLNLGNTSWT